MIRAHLILLTLPLITQLTGCCSTNSANNTTTCSITFSNPSPSPTCTSSKAAVAGYAIFSNGTTVAPAANIVIEWSTDSFATAGNLGSIVNNAQGFVAVPFAFNVGYCATVPTIQLRAFQSTDNTTVWKSGQVTGRFDGLDSGNTTYTSIAATQASDALIFLDGTGPQ